MQLTMHRSTLSMQSRAPVPPCSIRLLCLCSCSHAFTGGEVASKAVAVQTGQWAVLGPVPKPGTFCKVQLFKGGLITGSQAQGHGRTRAGKGFCGQGPLKFTLKSALRCRTRAGKGFCGQGPLKFTLKSTLPRLHARLQGLISLASLPTQPDEQLQGGCSVARACHTQCVRAPSPMCWCIIPCVWFSPRLGVARPESKGHPGSGALCFVEPKWGRVWKGKGAQRVPR